MHTAVPRYYESILREIGTRPDTTNHHRVIDFVNRTPSQIVVIDRNNIPVFLPPAPAGTNLNEPCVEIRTSYHTFGEHNLNSSFSCLELTIGVTGRKGDDRGHLYDAMGDNLKNRSTIGRDTTTVSRLIPYKDLKDSRCLYDRGSGFVFCIENYHIETLHPESQEGREMIGHQEYVKGRPTGTLFEIVDNLNAYKERFTFANNQVVRIPTLIDAGRPDGVYVTTVTDVGRSESATNTERLSMIDASARYGLYPTREEAETAGNPELLIKGRQAEMSRQLETLKAETAQMESDYKRQELELKHKLGTLDAANKQKIMELEAQANERAIEIKQLKDQLEARRAVRDDYYDQRSSVRDETKEWLKIVPLVIAAFCGGLLLSRR